MSEVVTVAIQIEVDGETKKFSANAQTSGDPHRVADGLLAGLTGTANQWLRDRRFDRERGADRALTS
jgi:hypothetical protein